MRSTLIPVILFIVALSALANAVEQEPLFLAFPKVPDFLPVSTKGFNPASGQCNIRSKDHCQREFSKALGAKDNIFNDLSSVKKYLQTYYSESKLEKGLLKVCVARANFYRCIGPQYDSCTDPFVLYAEAKTTPKAMTFQEAFEFSQIYRVLDFDCSGGQVQATAHYDCVLQTWKSDKYQAGIKTCVAALDKADEKNFCQYAQAFLDCVGSLYKTNVCPSSELSWWECERHRVGFSIDGFCPKLTCNTVISMENGKNNGVAKSDVKSRPKRSFVSKNRMNLYKHLAKENPRRILSDAKLRMKQKLN